MKAIAEKWVVWVVVVLSAAAVAFAAVFASPAAVVLIAMAPAVLILLMLIFKNPMVGFLTLFVVNYAIIALIRYSFVAGLSVVVDGILFLTFISVIVNIFVKRRSENEFRLVNGLTICGVIWFLFCCVEILNPTGLINAWVLSRGLTYYMLSLSVLTFMVFKTEKDVYKILDILSVLTLIGVAKGVMQQVLGFDYGEQAFLDAGAYKTHILASGTRYFSIYASAGILGAVMGQAVVIYAISAIYARGRSAKLYYAFVALCALYGMLISGTRGALAVPVTGFLLFILLSKKIKVMVPVLTVFAIVFFLLSSTDIGQSNAYIRRMRSAFNPNEPSLLVRKANQQILGQYLKNKPFGEGLGLSGVDAQGVSMRFTTSIPTDSWYVKIWVETGIVGLILHIAILVYLILHGSYLVLFKIKDYRLRGVLMALLCGAFGIMVSSYGNQVLGQYPVMMIVYMSLALVFMGKYFDAQITKNTIDYDNCNRGPTYI